jgi:hypothetical protein
MIRPDGAADNGWGGREARQARLGTGKATRIRVAAVALPYDSEWPERGPSPRHADFQGVRGRSIQVRPERLATVQP